MPLPFAVTLGDYTLRGISDQLPDTYASLRAHKVDEIGLSDSEGQPMFLQVEHTTRGSVLLVALRYDLAGGTQVGTLIVPETGRLFVGAGTTLLAYDLNVPNRLWIDEAVLGFWEWQRHGDVVLMSAELELAAWDIHGRKLWAGFVEPPWSYEVQGEMVHLDIMGEVSSFPLVQGPKPRRR
jgi:hypothetical protein